ncbi:MAG: hypothetical protein LBJ38_02355 [Oscillospiraceae bacterium]|jgi:DNA-directed RNA polymerase subunit K/omega|nr:hypothetical protein [Oscillospiraceae bacterium]
MKNFNLTNICGDEVNGYHFVMAVAERARALYDAYPALFKETKPVGYAVQEFVDRKWTLN